jgi:uncharacterized membrane protein (DUF485 family)
MVNDTYEKIGASPLFQELVRKRNRFSLLLSAIILIVYYSFVLFASTSPAEFATPVTEGSKWPIGLLIGWGIQAFAFIMTGVYVSRANSDFDEVTRTVVTEASR